METSRSESKFQALARAIYLAAGIIVLLWFFYEVAEILLLFFFSIIFALILNAPVTWLESRKIPRGVAAALVLTLVLGLLALLGWLVIPNIIGQLTNLLTSLPIYADNLSHQLAALFEDYPEIQKKLLFNEGNLSRMIPSLPAILGRIGRYSLSLLGTLFIVIVLFSMVVYMVMTPRPLLKLYITLFPPHLRDKGARALARASRMVIGWMWANLVVGAMEAVLTAVFLNLMHIPGVWVWSALAFFAEMVPKIGPYIMAAPPVLVALAIDPLTAFWVMLFYIVMNEVMGDFVMPRVRASTMSLHPVSTLFIMLAMASAFGLVGALIATPLAAFIKAYYEEFYLSRYPEDKQIDQRVNLIMYRDVASDENDLIGNQ